MISEPASGSSSNLLARYGLLDCGLIRWSVLWTTVVLVVFGVTTAIIPNPIFGRGIPPEPAAVAVWLLSAPLMGLVMATYFTPPPPVEATMEHADPVGADSSRQGTTLGYLGGVAAFLAIGCPTCNKIALLLLGASGAANVFGPMQPLLGAASLALLAGTAVWRLRLRGRGGACSVPARAR